MTASAPLSEKRLLRRGHPGYPCALDELRDPPRELAVRGALPDLSRAVAIVGTRRADERGLAFARTIARELVEAGCTIVSGGALGIDTAAHGGALDAGGCSVAVLPTGVDRPYPRANAALFRALIERGALLSEVPHQAPGFKSVFLDRNRLIAALARVVVVVQAPLPSGALSTAGHARALERPLLAVPHAPWDPRGAGCLTLLARGAAVCRNSGDVLSLAALGGGKPLGKVPGVSKKRKALRGLDADERRVAEALGGGALRADELCARTELPAPRVQRALLMLLLSKVIQEEGSGRYALVDCL